MRTVARPRSLANKLARALAPAFAGLKNELGNSGLADEARKAIEQTMSQLSKLGDEIQRFWGRQ
jgi:hypothetical protein